MTRTLRLTSGMISILLSKEEGRLYTLAKSLTMITQSRLISAYKFMVLTGKVHKIVTVHTDLNYSDPFYMINKNGDRIRIRVPGFL